MSPSPALLAPVVVAALFLPGIASECIAQHADPATLDRAALHPVRRVHALPPTLLMPAEQRHGDDEGPAGGGLGLEEDDGEALLEALLVEERAAVADALAAGLL